jgi:predicted GNAT superfamily acetyltransferase
VHIRELGDVAATYDVATLFGRIWRNNEGQRVIDPSTLRAMAHTGNYLAGAYDGPALVGASLGFFAEDGHLHSHVTGIAVEYQGRGIGRLLKQHQREWALARGRTAISWTFDPLVARNAYFNLHSLGASVVDYLPDFYGAMEDRVNAGDASDRLYVVWALDADPPPAPTPHDVPALLDRDGDAPLVGSREGAAFTVATPRDIQTLRSADPALAIRWRMAVRSALANALADGYRIAGITRDGRYLLEVPT